MKSHVWWSVLFSLSASAACASAASVAPSSTPPASTLEQRAAISWVQGSWGWTSRPEPCAMPQRVWLDRDAKYIVMEFVDPSEGASPEPDSARYRVLNWGPRVVRAQIVDEKRTTAAGEPVVWDFVQISDDSFCWHRADWDNQGCTAPLVRCGGTPPPRPSA